MKLLLLMFMSFYMNDLKMKNNSPEGLTITITEEKEKKIFESLLIVIDSLSTAQQVLQDFRSLVRHLYF